VRPSNTDDLLSERLVRSDIVPRAWTSRVAAKLFCVWSVFAVVALLLDEFLSPLGPNVFDPADIAEGVGGVALAVLVFHTLVRARLTFGDDQAALGTGELPSERQAALS
jgi:hypothetical protein